MAPGPNSKFDHPWSNRERGPRLAVVIPRKYARKRLCRLTGCQPTTVGLENASEINRHDPDEYRQDCPGTSQECEIRCAFLTTQTEAATGQRPPRPMSLERFPVAHASQRSNQFRISAKPRLGQRPAIRRARTRLPLLMWDATMSETSFWSMSRRAG